jgi:phenylacetate-CoA ligase
VLHLFDIALQLNGFPIKKAKTYFEKLQEIPEQDFENYVIQKKEEIVNYHINNNPYYQ